MEMSITSRSSVLYGRVVWRQPDVSEEHISCSCTVEEEDQLAACFFLASRFDVAEEGGCSSEIQSFLRNRRPLIPETIFLSSVTDLNTILSNVNLSLKRQLVNKNNKNVCSTTEFL
jgi:hypothetical protein